MDFILILIISTRNLLEMILAMVLVFRWKSSGEAARFAAHKGSAGEWNICNLQIALFVERLNNGQNALLPVTRSLSFRP